MDISQDQPSDNIGHTLYLKIDKNILQNITTAGYHIEINWSSKVAVFVILGIFEADAASHLPAKFPTFSQ